MGKEITSKAQESKTRRSPRPTLPTHTSEGGLSEIQRAQASPLSASPQEIAQLQGRYGNRAIQRLIQRAQAPQPHEAPVGLEGGEVDGSLQNQINTARGGGRPLDKNTGSQMGGALGADLGGVRVHTDPRAETLNRSLSARAFTLGNDVFFSKGAYNPGTSSGKQLLAHELTHVVQQGGAVRPTKDNKVQTKALAGPALGRGADLLRRSADGLIQRDIDRTGFKSKIKQERPFGITLENLKQDPKYQKLLRKIKEYNKENDRSRLKSVKRALAKIGDVLQKHFHDAYEYLLREIAKEEEPLSKSKKIISSSTSKSRKGESELPPLREPPPLREGPKPGDRQLLPSLEAQDDYIPPLRELPPLREGPKPGDRQYLPSFRRDEGYIPPLREGPKPGDRRYLPSFRESQDGTPSLYIEPEQYGQGIRFEDYDEDEGLEEKKTSIHSSPKGPSWREPRSSSPSNRNDFGSEKKEKKHSSKQSSRNTLSPTPRRNDEDLGFGEKELTPKKVTKESSRHKSRSIRSNQDDSESEKTPRKHSSKQKPLPSFRDFDDDSEIEKKEKKHSSKETSRQKQLPFFLTNQDDSSSEEETGVPYEQAVAERFTTESTGKIFLKLWETASVQQKEKLKSMFSDRKKYANLSGLEYVLEGLDPLHRLEHRGGLDYAAKEWLKSGSELYFFDWLDQQKNPMYQAKMGSVDYFTEEERQNYKLELKSSISFTKTGKQLKGDNIYVVSQANHFYARSAVGGSTDKGIVHHSSFMGGQAVKAAGHIEFKSPGKLASINLSSGHYRPKPEHMKNALRVLKRAQVDLSDVVAQPDMGSGEKFIAQEWLERHARFL